jgi:hypothetical protein
MPLFGPSPEEREAALDVVRPMIAWVQGAPPADLATELMAAFGPHGPGPDGATHSESGLFKWLFRGHVDFTSTTLKDIFLRQDAQKQAGSTLQEAMQLLEHAELVCVMDISDAGTRYWGATSLGLAALSNGKAAVRQRIKDRTGL